MIGVLANLSGAPERPLPSVGHRRFVDVDLDNLDRVLAACHPHLSLKIENKLSEDGSSLNITLLFSCLEDFRPENVARQISPLRQLLELRNKLVSLRTSLIGNDKLDELLQDVLHDRQKLEQLKAEVSPEVVRPAASAPAPPTASAPTRRENPPLRATLKEPPPGSGIWSTARHTESTSILDQIADVSRAETPARRETVRDFVKEFIGQVAEGGVTVSRDTEAMLNARIAQIDHLLSLQLREVLHSEAFQNLESTWRGLHFLLRRTRKAAHVKVRVLNVTKKELANQFDRERGRHDSPLARKVLDHAGGTSGANPFGLMIGDYTISRHPEDVDLLEKLARLGATAHVPFVASAAPDLLGFESFKKIVDAFQLQQIFDGEQYYRWRRFSARIESRYAGLVLPRMLLRLPYGRDTDPVEDFDFREMDDENEPVRFLWGSAAWAFAIRCASDFETYGWFGAKRTVQDRGEIQDLPVYVYAAEEGDLASIGPVEIPISDARYAELRTLGLIPLCSISDTNRATFLEAWSCHKPPVDPHADRDADSPTTIESSEIDCMLAVSYIAHCVQSVVREQWQHFSSVQACEDYLHKWIAPFVLPDYAKATSFESAFPLVGAQFHIDLGSEPRRPLAIAASLLPARPVSTLPHPVEIAIPIALPRALSWQPNETPFQMIALPVPGNAHTELVQASDGFAGGREHFIRRMYQAEACVANRKLDVAILILEDLAEQIDRYHLDEWESPKLVTHVWDLFRRCSLLTGASPAATERSTALLRRICRLDPTCAVE